MPELTDAAQLRLIAEKYLRPHLQSRPSGEEAQSSSPVFHTVDVYLKCRELAEERLVDGSNHRPRYTLRTLCRALSAAVRLMTRNKLSLKRAVYEAFQLAFKCQLDEKSQGLLQKTLKDALGSGLTAKDLDRPPPKPRAKASLSDYVLVSPFWLDSGPNDPTDWAEADASTGVSRFVLTDTAASHLRSLSRCVAAGPWPLLIEGPTSAGKTTLVEYLAARTGHRCVRINNHEHTDVQEYTGCYVADAKGSLVFREGILVEALRRGYWIILDELNLAPSEVLEALNRLLDDNRELYISETQVRERLVARPAEKALRTTAFLTSWTPRFALPLPLRRPSPRTRPSASSPPRTLPARTGAASRCRRLSATDSWRFIWGIYPTRRWRPSWSAGERELREATHKTHTHTHRAPAVSDTRPSSSGAAAPRATRSCS